MAVLTRNQEALIRSLATRHGRKESQYCLCDGPRASHEILTLRPDLVEQVILRDDFILRESLPVDPVVLSAKEFDRIRNTVHSQGILLLVRRPEEIPVQEKIDAPFVFLLDRIADPGNFGTMVRTARAVGLCEMWLTDGTVDPYSDKSIRSASGAQFSLRIRKHGDLTATLGLLKDKGFTNVFRTSPACGCNVFTEEKLFENSVIILGNEGGGVGDAPGSKDLNIPMPGDAESLNVAQAAPVILFEYVRRLGSNV